MKNKLLALTFAISMGASAGVTAITPCAWACFTQHSTCVESGGNEAACEREYKSCRSSC